MARILVIDDEEVVRRMLRVALESEGHEVLEASQGAEGLRLHREAPAELVITDIVMPEKNGIEVLLELRRDYPQPKVIAMSGGGQFNQMEALEIAEPLGAFATVRKPFRLEDLLDVVRLALAA